MLLENETINEEIKPSPIEHDSGLSENESSQTKSEPIAAKSATVLHPLSSSSDVESGINGDYPSSRKSSSVHHLSNAEMSNNPILERIAFEVNSIALDWCSYHIPLHCTCASPFDSAQRKVRSANQ